MSRTTSRPVGLLALLLAALAAGAFAALVAASFLWLLAQGTELLWSTLPDRLDLDPYGSWWLFAVPIVGGALIGVCHLVIGNYPRPLEDAIATWKQGGHLEPVEAPKSAVNSLVALTMGGPVGFEAALTGVIGGTATWVGARITAVELLVRSAWGAEELDELPRAARHLPYWLAAVAGLFTYHWMPFGAFEFDFRFTDFDGNLGVSGGVAGFAFGALIVVPVAWALSLVRRAETSMLFRRSPILIGMAGGLVFALMAVPNEFVLFSGQEGIQLLVGEDTSELLYLTVAKWAALVVALYAGWRGGPIFPTYTAVAAFAVVVDELIGVGPDIVMVAGIAATGVVFLKGNIPMALVLTLYPVQVSYAGVVLIGCLGGAVGLAIANWLGLVPAPAEGTTGLRSLPARNEGSTDG